MGIPRRLPEPPDICAHVLVQGCGTSNTAGASSIDDGKFASKEDSTSKHDGEVDSGLVGQVIGVRLLLGLLVPSCAALGLGLT